MTNRENALRILHFDHPERVEPLFGFPFYRVVSSR